MESNLLKAVKVLFMYSVYDYNKSNEMEYKISETLDSLNDITSTITDLNETIRNSRNPDHYYLRYKDDLEGLQREYKRLYTTLKIHVINYIDSLSCD